MNTSTHGSLGLHQHPISQSKMLQICRLEPMPTYEGLNYAYNLMQVGPVRFYGTSGMVASI